MFGLIFALGKFKFILELGTIISKLGFCALIFWYLLGLSPVPTIIPDKLNGIWACKLVLGTGIETPNPPFICGFGTLIFAFISGCFKSIFVWGIFIFGPFILNPGWAKLLRLTFTFGFRPFISISLFILRLPTGFWIFKPVFICKFLSTFTPKFGWDIFIFISCSLMPDFWISFPSKSTLRLGLTSTITFCPLKLICAFNSFNSWFSPMFISKFSWGFWLAFSFISWTSLLDFCPKSSFKSWFWFSFSSGFFISSFSSLLNSLFKLFTNSKFSTFSFSFGWFKLNWTPILIVEKSLLFFSSFSFCSNFFLE